MRNKFLGDLNNRICVHNLFYGRISFGKDRSCSICFKKLDPHLARKGNDVLNANWGSERIEQLRNIKLIRF